jgi:hypothetical protein
MIQNLINHVALVVDASGSMSSIKDETIKVIDTHVAQLAKSSKETDQETRVSIYLFNSSVEPLVYDMDVLRLPRIKDHYYTNGNTKLIDGTMQAISDLEQTPQLYGDHAFLLIAITDGEENASRNKEPQLKKAISQLKDNWTVSVMVPNEYGVKQAKACGFPAGNVMTWDTTAKGMNDIGDVMTTVTTSFMRARSTGVRSTKNLFNLDASSLSTTSVKRNLDELKTHQYEIFPVSKKKDIKSFVESWTGKPYVKGSAYYQITKPEKVQAYKQVCIQDKVTAKVYSGVNARDMLGLPDYEIQVDPASHGKWHVFIQSTSLNRNLVAGTQLLVLK